MRTKQVRPEKKEFEYELFIFTGFDSSSGRNFAEFHFVTTKIFESFIYKINIHPKYIPGQNEIYFDVEGLSAPVIDLSKSGAAVYNYRIFNYEQKKSYTLILSKNGKNKIKYILRFTEDDVKIIKKTKSSFIKILLKKKGID